jgi:hypothetical protein
MRKRTKRKHFDPDAHPLRLAMIGPRPSTEGELMTLQMAELMSLARLKAGNAELCDVHGLRRRILIAVHLGRQGIGPEVLPLATAARRVVDTAAAEPLAAAGDADGLAALRDLLDLHDQQRRAVPAVDLEAAIHAAVNPQRW